jgi:hypothetical protein
LTNTASAPALKPQEYCAQLSCTMVALVLGRMSSKNPECQPCSVTGMAGAAIGIAGAAIGMKGAGIAIGTGGAAIGNMIICCASAGS